MTGTYDHRIDEELAPFADIFARDLFIDVDAARAAFTELTSGAEPSPAEAGLEITDEVIEAETPVSVRVYRKPGDARRPGLLYMHGGGFMVGSVDSEHSLVVALADRLDVVIVSVDYRLVPEHPYPAPLDDCYVALKWLAERDDVDPDRIAIHGMSAGGGLAAALALRARDESGPAIRFQSLVVPVLDDTLETPSMRAFTDTPLWNRPMAELMWERYLAGASPVPIYAAPTRAEDLSGLPPAYVVANELDPLRDEAIHYALRLLAADVPVELHVFAGTFHASTAIPFAAVSVRANDELAGVLERALDLREGADPPA